MVEGQSDRVIEGQSDRVIEGQSDRGKGVYFVSALVGTGTWAPPAPPLPVPLYYICCSSYF